jgi:hypothetical protein
MYSHTQLGWMTIIALAGALIIVGAAGKELGLAAPGKGAILFAQGLLGLMIPLLGWLTVTVDEEMITARFGVGLVRKKIRIKDIQNAAQVRNKWHYGWGIRMGPSGWMFNVSGLDAVEIELKNGGKFRIGTDEPEELARAIQVRCSTFEVRS